MFPRSSRNSAMHGECDTSEPDPIGHALMAKPSDSFRRCLGIGPTSARIPHPGGEPLFYRGGSIATITEDPTAVLVGKHQSPGWRLSAEQPVQTSQLAAQMARIRIWLESDPGLQG